MLVAEKVSRTLAQLHALHSNRDNNDLNVKFVKFHHVYCMQNEGGCTEYLQAYCANDPEKCLLFGDYNDEDAITDGIKIPLECLVSRRTLQFYEAAKDFVLKVCVYEESAKFRLNHPYHLECLQIGDELHLLKHNTVDKITTLDSQTSHFPFNEVPLWRSLLECAMVGNTHHRKEGLLDSLLIGSISVNLRIETLQQRDEIISLIKSRRPCRVINAAKDVPDTSISMLPGMDVETGTIVPSQIQLPHNWLLVVDETGWTEGHKLDSMAMCRFHAIQDLITHQKIEIKQAVHVGGSIWDNALSESSLPSFTLYVSNPVIVISIKGPSLLHTAIHAKVYDKVKDTDVINLMPCAELVPEVTIPEAFSNDIHEHFLAQSSFDENGLSLALNLMRLISARQGHKESTKEDWLSAYNISRAFHEFAKK